MRTPNLKRAMETAFAKIEAAAAAGARCPTQDQIGVHTGAVGELCRAGRIRVEVYAHNWRVAEILDGPHKGKRTAPPPNPAWKPYLVCGIETTRQHRDNGQARVNATARIGEAERTQPSAPRALSREELERIR
jgi:hypothetical protein